MEIEGQAAIVSGGASGLGRATAEALTASAVKVTILDVNEAAATAAAHEIGGFAVGCDVTNAEAVEAAVAAARQRHGPVRIAVNCAASARPDGSSGATARCRSTRFGGSSKSI